LNAAGVQILAGADAQLGVFPGAALHREIANLVRCGLSPFQAVSAATGGAARFVSGQDDPDFGIVKVGSRADLLLVAGDPLANAAAVDDIVTVIKDGRVLERHPIPAGK
jgi:imidazolonepropionase-like amidohydrolase